MEQRAGGTPLPQSIKTKMLDELKLSRSMVRDGFDVVPRFRVFLADGDQHIWAPMRDDMEHRLSRLSLVKSFMIWRAASGFIYSGETIEPNAVVSSLVMASGVLAAYQEITRDPQKRPPHHVRFAAVELIGQVDPILVEALPESGARLTPEQEREVASLFGAGGQFEVEPVVN